MSHKKFHTMDFHEVAQPAAPKGPQPTGSEHPQPVAPKLPQPTTSESAHSVTSESAHSATPMFKLEIDGTQREHHLPSGDALLAGGGGQIPGQIDLEDPMMGQLVADRFRILSRLGQGGVGKVYCAEQLPLGRLVAIKLLHPHAATEQETKIRFQREAMSMTRLSHPGLATVYDFGEWQGQFFIAMEILQGVSLYKWLYQHFPFSTEQIVEVMSQIAEALSAAHITGLIHRDLKPENVMVLLDLQGQLQLKVVDWGMVLLQEGSKEQRLTLEGVTVGTPHYMSPEQCQGHAVDERSDIYALGTMLYEMLAGSTPFSGDNPMSLMIQQIIAQPQMPSQRNPRVEMSPILEQLALQCLAKNPADRPQTAQDFLTTLQSALASTTSSETWEVWQTPERHARADALGLPRLSDSVLYAPTAFSEYTFLVVEETQHYQDALTMQMWANGFTVKHSPNLPQATQDISRLKPAGLVVRLSKEAEASLEQLLTWKQQSTTLTDLPIVIVGPDDSFALMNRVLEQGLFDYVPTGQISSRLAKSIRRLIRNIQRKQGRS